MTIIRPVCTLETTKNGRQTFFSLFCILQTRTNSNTHTQRNEEQLKYWGNLFAHINFYLARQRIYMYCYREKSGTQSRVIWELHDDEVKWKVKTKIYNNNNNTQLTRVTVTHTHSALCVKCVLQHKNFNYCLCFSFLGASYEERWHGIRKIYLFCDSN